MRQCYVAKAVILNECGDEFIPYIVLDTDEESQSRRLQRPIQASANSSNLTGPSISPSIELTDRTLTTTTTATTTKSHQLASESIKQNLLKSNQVLNQIREVSSERFPGQESQLSFKPMSPKAAPLPPDLQALVRSEPIKNNNRNEEEIVSPNKEVDSDISSESKTKTIASSPLPEKISSPVISTEAQEIESPARSPKPEAYSPKPEAHSPVPRSLGSPDDSLISSPRYNGED